MIFEILLGMLILLYIAEAWHDDKIERVQMTGDIKPIEAWHKADTYFHFIMNITLSYALFVFAPIYYGLEAKWLHGIIFGIMMLGLRQLFMVIPLNLFRGRKPFYIGTTARFDKFFKGKGWVVFVVAGLLEIGGYYLLKFIL